MSSSPVVFKLVLTTFIWAAVFHLGKFAVSILPPGYVSAWRFLLAAALLLPLAALREGLPWKALRRNAVALAAMSLVGVFGFNACMSYGLRTTSAINGALIMAFNPALTMVLSALINREPVTARLFGGLALALAGVLTVVSKGSLHALASLSFAQGDLLILLGSLGWALYSVIPRRHVHGLSTTQITAATLAGGAVLLTVLAWIEPDSAGMLAAPGLPGGATIAFMGVFGSVLAYLWWNAGLGALGPASGAVFINLVPVFATLIGLALGQPVSLAQWMGALLVMAGVSCAGLAPRRRAPTAVIVSR